MNNKEELLNAILECASNKEPTDDIKRLTCAEAFGLAKKYKTQIIEIGHICNENKIKICKCQLGCFE